MSRQTAFRSAASEWRVWRFLGLAHLSGIVIFLGVMAGFLWYVESVEKRERQEALYRDIEWAQQSLRLHLREVRDNLARSAPVWVEPPNSELLDLTAPRDFLAGDAQAIYMAFTDPSRVIQWSIASPGTALRASSSFTPRRPPAIHGRSCSHRGAASSSSCRPRASRASSSRHGRRRTRCAGS